MSKPSFTREDLIHWLGMAEIEKGKPYIASIHDVNLGPEWITAKVQGSARRPYTVVATYAPVASGTLFEAECTCPVGYRCKHIAATYLYWMQLESNTAPAGDENAVKTLKTQPAEVLDWLEQLVGQLTPTRTQAEAPVAKRTSKKPQIPLNLLYCIRSGERFCAVSLWKAKQSGPGEWMPTENWNNIERALRSPPKFVMDEDLPLLLKLYQSGSARYSVQYPEFMLEGDVATGFLQTASKIGRLAVLDSQPFKHTLRGGYPLLHLYHLGEMREGRVGWQIQHDGSLRVSLAFKPEAEVLMRAPLWYTDSVRREIGPAAVVGADNAELGADLLETLLLAPALDTVSVPLVAKVLKDHGFEGLAPAADLSADLQVIDVEPQIRLRLNTMRHQHYIPRPPYHENYLDYAELRFAYDGHELEKGDKDVFSSDSEGGTVHIKRHVRQEEAANSVLIKNGMVPLHSITYLHDKHLMNKAYGLLNSELWMRFVEETLPRLRAEGWDVRYGPDFRHAYQDIDAWHGDLEEQEDGWFNLAMGIEVSGQKIPLQPLLSELFARDKRWLAPDGLKTIPDSEKITLMAAGIGRIGIRAERLKPIVSVLIDLFDGTPTETESLRISGWDAARMEDLAGLADRERWQFKGHDAVRQLARRLRGADMPEIQAPAGFQGQLRPYQLDGLRWLQYLRSQNLSGVLADDMGLGKTAQSIAHLQTELEFERMDRPTLIVMPTSLLFNWNQELARFAPALKVLTLHGMARKETFGQIPDHHVILTTYPLLWRDADELKQFQYHILILDEAQSVKNAASKAAVVVRSLQARHRLALTGTPLENHLGELWSLFDYLLPGFLGDAKEFTKRWRTPIEKQGDRVRADLLARRIRPFILRRKKEDVARELPPKTIIVRSVELEAAQRDLYETVRIAMDEKVRQEIASKGFKRSQIVILDALLKLRQACCDPSLVKIAAAHKVKQSAKLELLMEMLPELISEGRRILLFSQFTTMLEIIEDKLIKQKIPYVKLTGSTRDRATPVEQFQAGKTPLFLISLKAGGVGLNLTAADTVIHYDPWWNPAVENQATDRAHRIGQEKNVFVYKLVVAGSIEEKIMALQEKKAALAEGILSEDGGELSKFNENDISALLEALPE